MMKELLKKVPIFSNLSDKEIEKILEEASETSYKKNDLIFLEEDEGNSLFIIKSGKVKISRSSEEGKEVIFAILQEGDFFGEMSIFDGQSRSATVSALVDSEVIILRREDFMNLIETNPAISVSLLKEMAKRLRKSDTQIKRLSLFKAKERVASTILQLADTDKIEDKDVVEIRNIPSQTELSKIAGTSREVFSKSLNDLIKDGLIKKDGRKITILDVQTFLKRYF